MQISYRLAASVKRRLKLCPVFASRSDNTALASKFDNCNDNGLGLRYVR